MTDICPVCGEPYETKFTDPEWPIVSYGHGDYGCENFEMEHMNEGDDE